MYHVAFGQANNQQQSVSQTCKISVRFKAKACRPSGDAPTTVRGMFVFVFKLRV